MTFKAFLALTLIGISLAGAPAAHSQTAAQETSAKLTQIAPADNKLMQTEPQLKISPRMFERTQPGQISVPLSGPLKFTVMEEERLQHFSNLDPRRGASTTREFRSDRTGLGSYDRGVLASANIRLKF